MGKVQIDSMETSLLVAKEDYNETNSRHQALLDKLLKGSIATDIRKESPGIQDGSNTPEQEGIGILIPPNKLTTEELNQLANGGSFRLGFAAEKENKKFDNASWTIAAGKHSDSGFIQKPEKVKNILSASFTLRNDDDNKQLYKNQDTDQIVNRDIIAEDGEGHVTKFVGGILDNFSSFKTGTVLSIITQAMTSVEEKEKIFVDSAESTAWKKFKKTIDEHLKFIDEHFDMTTAADKNVTSLTLKHEYNAEKLALQKDEVEKEIQKILKDITGHETERKEVLNKMMEFAKSEAQKNLVEKINTTVETEQAKQEKYEKSEKKSKEQIAEIQKRLGHIDLIYNEVERLAISAAAAAADAQSGGGVSKEVTMLGKYALLDKQDREKFIKEIEDTATTTKLNNIQDSTELEQVIPVFHELQKYFEDTTQEELKEIIKLLKTNKSETIEKPKNIVLPEITKDPNSNIKDLLKNINDKPNTEEEKARAKLLDQMHKARHGIIGGGNKKIKTALGNAVGNALRKALGNARGKKTMKALRKKKSEKKKTPAKKGTMKRRIKIRSGTLKK
jgi:hypothetical protein